MKRTVVWLLLAFAGCARFDVLVTEEPDAFFCGRTLDRGQVDGAVRAMHFGQEISQRVVYGGSVGYGVADGWEARAGWSLAGLHLRGSDSTSLWLNALELRGRRQLLADGPFRLAAGAGCDVILADPDNGGPVEYYGLRPMLQAAAGVFAPFGFGVFVPLSLTCTKLRPPRATGLALTPGAGVAFEHEYFFVRASGNVPLGAFFGESDTFLRAMVPSGGLELGGKLRLLQ